jgi:hypothetical protein
MLMDRKKFEAIREKYGRVSSWAIWNPDDYADTSVIDQHVDDLTTDFVLVGLNVSRSVSHADWVNFHTRHRGTSDPMWMKDFNDSPYRGAYMTDILKDWVDPDSSSIERSIKEHPERLKAHIKSFLQELGEVGAEGAEILVFGNTAWGIFVNSLELRRLNIRKLRHPAAWKKAREGRG